MKPIIKINFTNLFRILSILSLFVVLVRPNYSLASDETVINSANPTVGTSFWVYDGKYNDMLLNPTTWQTAYTNKKVTNIVRLAPVAGLTVNFDVTVNVTVEGRKWDPAIMGFSPFSVTTNLQVNSSNSTSTLVTVTDKQALILQDGHALKVIINTVNFNSGTTAISNLVLTSEITVERQYFITSTAPTGLWHFPNSSGAILTASELDMSWDYTPGAEWYELEYVHISKLGENNTTVATSLLNYNYYLNSTRVEVKGNHYVIPKIYDQGYLIYRVRAIGFNGINYSNRFETDWTAAESGTISTHTAANVIDIVTPYDSLMNWSHVASFAEDGKRSDAIQFEDGMGRGRQTVISNPATKQVIVNNTYYDEMGRPAVSDLPTPVDQTALNHQVNFNRANDGSNTPFQYTVFDSLVSDCASVPTAFSTSYGAGKYYSVNNPDKDGANAGIPDAEGYPYVRITYKDDLLSRVDKEGSAGRTLKANGGKETRYADLTSDQLELNRMFGSDIGWANQYNKTAVIDQNGQIMVSYSDLTGRTVATYLTGASPTSLDALTENVVTPSTNNLILNGASDTDNPAGPSSNLSYTKLIATTGNYTFNYGFTPAEFTQVCGTNSICLECVYDFNMKIVDECGEVYLDTTMQVNGEVFDTGCEHEDFALNPITRYLYGAKEGRNGVIYTFTKNLSVNHDAIDSYWCYYLDASCIDEVPTIFNDLYSTATFSGCEPLIADSAASGPCAIYKTVMLADMSPNGQYADYIQDGALATATDPVSILNTSTAGTKYDDVTYLDHLGAPITVVNDAGNTVSPATLSLSEFVQKFRPEWALSLLPLHPEYCFYTNCMTMNSAPSTAFDQAMLSTTSFQSAISAGYFNPLPGESIVTHSYLFGAAVSTPDPFFAAHAALADSMDALMEAYITINGSTYSMWDYAVILGMPCPGDSPQNCVRGAVLSGNCSLDYIWIKFRELYLEAKQNWMNRYPSTSCSSNCAIGVSGTYAAKVRRWPCWADLVAGNPNLSDPFAAYTGEIEDWCDQTCTEYADEWLVKLAGCNISGGILTSLRQDLINLCKSGCSTSRPEGFASNPNGHTINTVLASYGIAETDWCSELLITEPGLYQTTAQAQSEIEIPLDVCGCDAVMQAREDLEDYLATNPSPVLFTTIEEMLAHNTGISLEEVDPLLCACDEAKNKFGSGWETNPSTPYFLNNYQYAIPEALSCNTNCADCATVTAAMEVLEDRFSGIDLEASPNHTIIVTNYLNQTFNKDYNYFQYLEFFSLCNANSEAPFCRENPGTKELLDLLTLLAYRGQLTSTSPVDLQTNNAVYELGTIRNALPSPGLADYSYSVSGSTVTLTFGTSGDQCALTIDNATGIDFSSILSFDLIANETPGCSSTPTYSLSLTYLDCGQTAYATLPVSSSCFKFFDCICTNNGVTLCSVSAPQADEACYAQTLNELYLATMNTYHSSVEEAYDQFTQAYLAKCSEAFVTENLSYTGFSNDYQYTLFYYDQAGNLVRTTAPQGVNLLPASQSTAVDYAREHAYDTVPAARVVPTHTFLTNYTYNTYNQLVNTSNPDQTGTTTYYYDYYGRSVASQNPEQALIGQYSYILYDVQGRPVESGQMNRTVPSGPGGAGYTVALLSETAHLKKDDLGADFKSWVYLGTRSEVTITTYDKPLSTAIAAKFKSGKQQNLRLRVATVAYFETIPNPRPVDFFYAGYTSAVHYSYDIHGNVIEQLQDVPELAPLKQDVKSTQYDFELISGNVSTVSYQKGEPDQFIHTYNYDVLNRLTEAHTSPDGYTDSREAHYLYYDYGPLARKELGQEKVQAEDYAYTINGWQKLKNGTQLNPLYDAGKDGRKGYEPANVSGHFNIPADVTSYTLGYFEGDYKAISRAAFETPTAGTAFGNSAANLYNGNIRLTTTAIQGDSVVGASYHYDQLNRLKSMKAYFDNAGINKGSATSWGAATANNAYSSAYTYDRNGNLKTLNRYGYSTSAMIDQLTYNYVPNRNRLHRVNDLAGVATNGDISSGQLDSNYVYDRLGQLTQDVAEGITNMNWRKGDRKLRNMTRSGHIISFLYDPFGRRIAKIYRPNGTTDKTQWTYTYYGNDANGATMAVYDIKYASNYVYLREQHIYGAGRVGMVQLNKTIYANAVITPPATTLSTNTLGNKRYELVNHLGNVNAVITDRKAPNTAYSALAYDFDFASTGNTGWTISGCSGTTATLSSGRLRFTPGSACAFNVYKDFPVTASSPYTISFDVDRTGISSLNVEIYTTGGTTSLVGTITNPANGTITYTLTPAAGQTGIRVHFKKLSTENVSFYTDNLRIQTMASPYIAMVVSTSDYYPFGMQMPGRHKDENLYRYGYNGMEKDDEAKNLSGTSYTTEFRQYDPRLGRWASLDPLMNEFPGMSPYIAFNDNPIYYVDPLGLKGTPPIGKAIQRMIGAAMKEFGARLKAAQTGEEYDVDEVVIKPTGDQKKLAAQKKFSKATVIAAQGALAIGRFFGALDEATQPLKGRSYDAQSGVGNGMQNKAFGREMGGVQWLTNNGSDYSSFDFNHFVGKFVEVEHMPIMLGSLNGGRSAGKSQGKFGSGKINPYRKPIERLDAPLAIKKMYRATESIKGGRGSLDAHVAKSSERIDKVISSGKLALKPTTSEDIYVMVWHRNGWKSGGTTEEGPFKNYEEAKETYKDLQWNEQKGYWEANKSTLNH